MTQRRIRQLAWFMATVILVMLSSPVMALMDSVGENGINAHQLHEPPLNLTGRKIAIGQIEIGRPAQFGLDKAGSTNRSVRPNRLFFGMRPQKLIR